MVDLTTCVHECPTGSCPYCDYCTGDFEAESYALEDLEEHVARECHEVPA